VGPEVPQLPQPLMIRFGVTFALLVTAIDRVHTEPSDTGSISSAQTRSPGVERISSAVRKEYP